MSLSTSRSPEYQPDDHPRPGTFWRWLTPDPKPPVHHLIIDHPRPPRRLWWMASLVGNAAVLLSGLAVGGAVLCTAGIAVAVIDKHPELFRVAALHLSAKIDGWETAHGYDCIRWSSRDEHGELHNWQGGPACPPRPQQETPSPASTLDEGDAP